MLRRIYPDLHSYFRENGDSVTQVASDVGCSIAHLSMIKWGTRQPTLALALRIAERCGVPLESLLRPSERRASA